MTLDKSTEKTQTLGQAIDEIINALTGLNDSERRTAIKAACEHLKIRLDLEPTRASAIEPTKPSVGSETLPSGIRSVDIRAFKDQKQPSSGIEMTAIVAFYLSELAPEDERESEIGVEDIKKYFKQAHFPLPKRPEFTLVNAKNSGYFESAGGGKYRLNTVGYNLVAHSLPRSQAVGAGRSGATKRRGSKAKTSSKRKPSPSPKK